MVCSLSQRLAVRNLCMCFVMQAGVCGLLAGVDSFAELEGAELLLTEEVSFLQSIADCNGLLPKRCADVLTLRAEPKPLKIARVEQTEELLSRAPISDMDIKGCGPRAAGSMFLKVLNSRCDRCVSLLGACMCTSLCLYCVVQE